VMQLGRARGGVNRHQRQTRSPPEALAAYADDKMTEAAWDRDGRLVADDQFG